MTIASARTSNWFGRRDPDSRGYFGEFGGRFVPETLVAPIQALEDEYLRARQDEAFAAELSRLLTHYVGRETPLWDARGLRQHCGGARILLKREDLTHTGAHKINNALGQALLAVRMGKKRIVAETGAGQHGVASATACALLGLECVVYMGAEDMARQALNVFRMRLLGTEVRSVDAGSKTLKDAINEAMRDWVARPHDTHYLLGLGAGPASVSVDGARVPVGHRPRGAGAVPRADWPAARRRRSRASAAAATPSASSMRSSTMRTSGSLASRPAGKRSRRDATRPGLPAVRPACCRARARSSSRTKPATSS